MRYGAVVCPRIPMVLLQHILHLMVHCGGGGGRAAGGRRWLLAGEMGGHGQTFLNLLAPSLSSFFFLQLLAFSRVADPNFMSQKYSMQELVYFLLGGEKEIIGDTEALQRNQARRWRGCWAKMNPFSILHAKQPQ